MKSRIKIDWKTLGGYALSIAAFAMILVMFLTGTIFFSRKADQNGSETLRKSIQRASVQCYSIEGRYPPSVEYLEDNYGVQIDRKKYNVFYSGFASNIMPDITVVEAEEEE